MGASRGTASWRPGSYQPDWLAPFLAAGLALLCAWVLYLRPAREALRIDD